MSTGIIDTHTPEYEKATALAAKYVRHCRECNYPSSLVLAGVAFDAGAIYKDAHRKGYAEGKQYEKDRIAELVGLKPGVTT